jgi:hypothetical protein
MEMLMRLQSSRAILTVFFLLSAFCSTLAVGGQPAKAQKEMGTDFQHPIYLPVEPSKSTVRGVGDYSLRRDIVYILRLNAGQQLKATLASAYTADRPPTATSLFLVDGKTKSFEDAQVLDRKLGEIDRTQKPSDIRASLVYTAPITADYFLVADFQGVGIKFTLTTSADITDIPQPQLTCVTGPVVTPIYLYPGVPNSLISDFIVGEPTQTDPPDDHNRHFCLTEACNIRPPTSLVLTIKLWEAFSSKKRIRACWDITKTITEIVP